MSSHVGRSALHTKLEYKQLSQQDRVNGAQALHAIEAFAASTFLDTVGLAVIELVVSTTHGLS